MCIDMEKNDTRHDQIAKAIGDDIGILEMNTLVLGRRVFWQKIDKHIFIK